MINLSEQDKNQLLNWLNDLNIGDVDLEKVIVAFTHPSYKGMNPNAEDYERLEFLGDAVLELISAEELVRNYNLSEGSMTERRKQIVNNEYLSQVFDRLKIQPLTRAAVSYVPSIKDKANFVEALFGAVYLDKGYERCKELWDLFQKKMGINKKKTVSVPMTAEQKQNKDAMLQFYKQLGLTAKNAKSLLQELCQKQNLPIPEYTLLERIGPDHDPVFRVKVSAILFNRPPSWTYSEIGEGKSKKIAELKAAEKLCNKVFLNYIPSE
jgi:ribonuclease-3